MSSHYLQAELNRKEAISKMNTHLQSKWLRRLKRNKTLVSVEKMYIPFWCFDYYAEAHSVTEGMEGRIAIDPINHIKAILPMEHPVQQAGETTFPSASKILSEKHAESAIYWELFSKEKKRHKIKVVIQDQWLVHVPYWIGYTKDRKQQYDIIAVDALNGKVDFPIKDTIFTYLKEAGA
ncbi:hypothetical protein [Halobacillus yeomjeoni]|uniref:Uncharacterized protein n=1 Tax=Halobacillus yeomjeoni TaxID=311194 RepID=A0A931HTD1_9BACI|nr:hypothetical protein [Halobacillus yeomjeoni]MBH0229427.1 hypothetical protein [Halobacillus yeomjeoni]